MRTSFTLLLLALCAACSRTAAQAPFDLVIAGGSVLNGEGTPAVTADVGIRDGRIPAIGDMRTA
jgi:urease alpha subunit